MPLIQCPECAKSVSDKAPACIHCGAPFRVAAATKQPTSNIRVTRAGFRYEAIGAVMMIIGVPSCMMSQGSELATGITGALAGIGFIVFMIGRFIN